MSENDIEAYTPNQLAMAQIKALRRIAGALEEQNKISVEVFKFRKEQTIAEAREIAQRMQPAPEIPDETPHPFSKYYTDENPDATDLGLTDEEKAAIEAEIKPAAPRAMPRTPVKGKK